MGRLCITRRQGEGFSLKDRETGTEYGTITIQRIFGRKIHVVVEAPDSTHILRSELKPELTEPPNVG